MKFYLDTEFNGHGGKTISLALVTEGRVPLYIVNNEPMNMDAWLLDNVMKPSVLHSGPVKARNIDSAFDFGVHIRDFIGDIEDPCIIADSPVDIGRFCEAISTDWNGSWRSTDYPRMTFEVYNVECYPTDLPGAVQHNALWDALALQHKLRNHPDSKRRRYQPKEPIEA